LKLFDELRRRNVFKVAAAYLALCWLVVQATATIGPMFDLPPSAGRVVVWIGLLGLPVAVVVSWIYEITPEGLRPTREVYAGESIARDTGRRLNWTIIGLLLLVIVLLAVERFVGVAGGLGDRQAKGAESGAAAPATDPAKARVTPPSIAVLPFVDMSQARDQEYFAEGLSEELLSLLAQLPQLRVIARTSSFSFKDKDADVATIAKALDVDHILEGSVRKSGDRLRVTAQLVRASDSTHLWSNTYDRRLTDVFAVQEEIAAAVVNALKVRLLPSQSLTGQFQTANAQAYNQYLLGIQYLRNMSQKDSPRALAALRRAVELDPLFAPAYAQLAVAEFYASEWAGIPGDLPAARQRAFAAAERAIELAPELSDGYAQRGTLRAEINWDWRGAEQDLTRARALDPANDYAQLRHARLLSALGRPDEAIATLQRHLAADPLDANAWAQLAYLKIHSGDLPGALDAAERAVALNPASDLAIGSLATAQLVQGQPQATIDTAAASSPFWRTYLEALAYHSLGDRAAAERALSTLMADGATGAAYQIASVYGWWGQRELAMEWLERAYENRDGGLALVRQSPFLAGLHDDPRYLALLKKMGLTE
jgi:TolB-like protein